MSDGFQFLDIIIFAMVAAFLILRLRSVLGRRTGHHQQRPDPLSRNDQQEAGADKIVELPSRSSHEASAEDISETPLESGLTQIRVADRAFDGGEFVTGAQAAFEMIVEAFAAGNANDLRPLLSNEVFENFNSAIRNRQANNEVLETTLVGLKSADLIEAYMKGRTAFVTIKFVSEQINVTRDETGEITEGDPNRVTDVTDIWTFARNTRSRDPNWTLVETRSPN